MASNAGSRPPGDGTQVAVAELAGLDALDLADNLGGRAGWPSSSGAGCGPSCWRSRSCS